MTRPEGGRVIELAAVRAQRARTTPIRGVAMTAWVDGGQVVLEFPTGERVRLSAQHLRIWRNNFDALLGAVEANERGER